MRIKLEPKEDITTFELATIIRVTAPFASYNDCGADIWDKWPENVRRHFDIEETKE